MNSIFLTTRKLRTVSLAVTVLLAILVAPLCSSRCDASGHCSDQITIGVSATSDCHHALISGKKQGIDEALSTARHCSRPELSALAVDGTNTSSTLASIRARVPWSVAAAAQSGGFFAIDWTRWLDAGSASLPKGVFTHSVVLRI